jgi:hypothetical protein
MTDGPQNSPANRGEQPGQQQQGHQSGQRMRNTDENYQKRVSRDGTESEQARENKT